MVVRTRIDIFLGVLQSTGVNTADVKLAWVRLVRTHRAVSIVVWRYRFLIGSWLSG